jgi:site-specific recombinase XerD
LDEKTHKSNKNEKSTVEKLLLFGSVFTGLKDVAPKDASLHSAATHILQRGGSTRLVQEILSPADIRTSELYTHCLVKDQEKVKSGKAEAFGKRIV